MMPHSTRVSGSNCHTMVRGPFNLGLSRPGAHFLCQPVPTDHNMRHWSPPLTIWGVSCDRKGTAGLESIFEASIALLSTPGSAPQASVLLSQATHLPHHPVRQALASKVCFGNEKL